MIHVYYIFDSLLVIIKPSCIAWEHWPDTREFITRSAEF